MIRRILVFSALFGLICVSVCQAGFFDNFNCHEKILYGKLKSNGIVLATGFDFWKGVGKYKPLRAGLGWAGETKIIFGDCSVNLKELAEIISGVEWAVPGIDLILGAYLGGVVTTGELDYGVDWQLIKFDF